MDPVLNRQQIREYDRIAIDELGVPGVVLMENAGRAATDFIARLVQEKNLSKIIIICGTGNNGGDGFVVARHLLAQADFSAKIRSSTPEVLIFVVGDEKKISGDAEINYNILRQAGIPVEKIQDNNEIPDRELQSADLIVDALFGTGLTRPVQGLEAKVIAAINNTHSLRIALDLPSGIDADTGKTLGIAVQATHTLSFAYFKPGLLTPAGRLAAGEIHRIGLEIPDKMILRRTGHCAELIAESFLSEVLPRRAATTYKHRAGDILVIAGSHGKMGAARLAAEATLRAGAGLATILTWQNAATELAAILRELMLSEIPEHDVVPALETAWAKRSALVIGPGLGIDVRAEEVVIHTLLTAPHPVVADADALTLMAQNMPRGKYAGPRILTPHSGELARLLNISSQEVEADRFTAVRRAAQEYQAVVVLKGAHTLIASPEGKIRVSPYANPVLATAGSGDVLSGIVGAFSALLPPFDAATAGVIAHAKAAEIWAGNHPIDRGMLAGDLIAHLPEVLALER